MPSRLILALALSLALHGSLLLPDVLKRSPVAPSRPVLQAALRLPPAREMPPAEPLLKNTLDQEETPKAVKTLTVPPVTDKPSSKPRPSIKREVQIAQRKLSEYVFYPEAARVRGIEGTVRLLLVLSADGSVEDVRVIASSGHPILDSAAAKGGWAIQKLPGTTVRELPLDYTFKLVP